MLWRWTILILAVAAGAIAAAADERPTSPRAGIEFQSPATQVLQGDDSANPGMLWVERGRALWAEPAGAGVRACSGCHGDAAQSMAGVAARLPALDAASGRLMNLEGRINACRVSRQGAPAFAYESQELLGLTAFISLHSRGRARTVAIDGAAAPYFEAGRRFYQARQGQMNLACGQCHDDNVGRKLRGDTISQGQTHGWPAYRLDWQAMGSLQRRLRACSLGVRAEVLDYGAPEYLALELYLAWRGGSLPLESPGVRR